MKSRKNGESTIHNGKNAQGKTTVKVFDYNSDGKVDAREEYDANGKLTRTIAFDENGKVDYMKMYEYDEKGEMIKERYDKNGGGKVDRIEETCYDEK